MKKDGNNEEKDVEAQEYHRKGYKTAEIALQSAFTEWNPTGNSVDTGITLESV